MQSRKDVVPENWPDLRAHEMQGRARNGAFRHRERLEMLLANYEPGCIFRSYDTKKFEPGAPSGSTHLSDQRSEEHEKKETAAYASMSQTGRSANTKMSKKKEIEVKDLERTSG